MATLFREYKTTRPWKIDGITACKPRKLKDGQHIVVLLPNNRYVEGLVDLHGGMPRDDADELAVIVDESSEYTVDLTDQEDTKRIIGTVPRRAAWMPMGSGFRRVKHK